jgi:hypothetical protein
MQTRDRSSETPTMLETYLNDHLAGAAGALDLIGDIAAKEVSGPLADFLIELRREVAEDRDALVRTMQLLGVSEQRFKQFAATAAESVSRLAIGTVTSSEKLERLLELEALSAGIWTKGRLWTALASSPHTRDRLVDVDLDELTDRAERQLAALESHRRELAAAIFAEEERDPA